jgi:glycosyltransferase involved in cell wall biosynthesis
MTTSPLTRSGPEISLVMPCYNEEAVVRYTISRLLNAFRKSGYALEIVAVDNGSSDRTGEIIRELAAADPAVVHHRVEVNQGYGNGVLEGMPVASAPWVGIIPADGQVDAEDVVRLYEAVHLTNSWVLAKVRRRFRLDGLNRKIVSVTYNVLFRLMWPSVGSIDINGSPKLMPRKAIAAMGLKNKGWFLDAEIMIKSQALGMRIVELNVFARLRSAGVSHVKPNTCWEFLRSLIVYRFSNRWKRDLMKDRGATEVYSAAGAKG